MTLLDIDSTTAEKIVKECGEDLYLSMFLPFFWDQRSMLLTSGIREINQSFNDWFVHDRYENEYGLTYYDAITLSNACNKKAFTKYKFVGRVPYYWWEANPF